MGTGPIGKRRNAGVVWFLSIITLLVYYVWWHYTMNKEIRTHDPSQRFSPGLAALAAIIPIANLVSLYNTAARVGKMQKANGATDPISPVVALLLTFLFMIGYMLYVQGALNEHWEAHRLKA